MVVVVGDGGIKITNMVKITKTADCLFYDGIHKTKAEPIAYSRYENANTTQTIYFE